MGFISMKTHHHLGGKFFPMFFYPSTCKLWLPSWKLTYPILKVVLKMIFPIPQLGYVNSLVGIHPHPPQTYAFPPKKLRPYEPPFVREDLDGTFSNSHRFRVTNIQVWENTWIPGTCPRFSPIKIPQTICFFFKGICFLVCLRGVCWENSWKFIDSSRIGRDVPGPRSQRTPIWEIPQKKAK